MKDTWPALRRPQGRPRTYRRDYITQLALESLVVFLEELGGGSSGEDGLGVLSDIATPTVRALISRAKWRENRNMAS